MPHLEYVSYAITNTDEVHITIDEARLGALTTFGLEKLVTELNIILVEMKEGQSWN